MKHLERAFIVVWGLAHFGAALILLPLTFSLGFITIPIVLPGSIWLVILGIALIIGYNPVRSALRLTHWLLALVAVQLLGYGFHCLDAARRSAESGGGLLGSFGLIPITMGVLLLALSIISLIAARSDRFMNTVETQKHTSSHFHEAGTHE